MATDWVVGIGGTGGKVLDVLVNMLSLGVGQGLLDGSAPRDLKLFLLDQDQNPWAGELLARLKKYRDLRREIGQTSDNQQPLRRNIQACEPFPFKPLGDRPGKKTLAYDLLPQNHNEAKAFLPWDEVLTKDIRDGFYGKPALGASALAWMSFQPGFKQAFLDPLVRDVNTAVDGDQVRVFLVGGGFGGTGSAGLRTLATLFRDYIAEEGSNHSHLLSIHGIILGPYFAPVGTKDGPKIESWLTTACNRIRCGQVLSDLSLTQPFDSLILFGEPVPVGIPSNEQSGAGQLDNPYHPIEVLAACHVLDLDECRISVDPANGHFVQNESKVVPLENRGSLKYAGPEEIGFFVRPIEGAAWGHFPGGLFRKAEMEATLAHGLLLAREVESPPTPVVEYLAFLQDSWEWFHKRFVAKLWHPKFWVESIEAAPHYEFWDGPTEWPAESQVGIFYPAMRLQHFQLAKHLLLGAKGSRDWGKEDVPSIFTGWWKHVGPKLLAKIPNSQIISPDPGWLGLLPFSEKNADGISTTPRVYNHTAITKIVEQLVKGVPGGSASASDRLSFFPTFWAVAQDQRFRIGNFEATNVDFVTLDAELKSWLGLAYGVFMGVFLPVQLDDTDNLSRILDKTSPSPSASPYFLLQTKTLPGRESVFVGGHDPRGGLWLIPEACRKNCGWPNEPVDLGQGISLGSTLTWTPPPPEALPKVFMDFLNGFDPIGDKEKKIDKLTNLRQMIPRGMAEGELVSSPELNPNKRYHPLKTFRFQTQLPMPGGGGDTTGNG